MANPSPDAAEIWQEETVFFQIMTLGQKLKSNFVLLSCRHLAVPSTHSTVTDHSCHIPPALQWDKALSPHWQD